jgi:diguanylate cyclase (GGDEF)-like protein
VGAGALLLLSLPLIWLFISRSVVRPLRAMATATKSMASGDYTRRIAPSRIPELATLAMGVNHLAERVEAQIRDLSHQAFHDGLTGLPNRALFLDRLEHALARAQRQGPSVVVIFLDLDNFKVFNDTLGHNAADELLSAVGERLRGALRGPDTLARLGGDEFTVLLEDASGLEDALGAVHRIQSTLQEPFTVGGKELFTTASIGITLGDSRSGAELLVREADLAMYRAKANGKARYEIFDATMSAQLEARLGLETDLRRALERNEFRLQYQPIIDLSSGLVDGVEALVRWEHPQRGLVAPFDFIPLAEETGLIVPIGRWVLTEACRQASEWQAVAAHPLTVSVNLSARQLMDGDLPSDVAEALRESGLDAGLLKLEVTETTLIEDAEATLAKMDSIRALGVEFVIDDFGVGYSALSYVKRFPFQEVKIDKTFVDGLASDNPQDSAIVEAVASFARALGLRVTGEGIEEERQAARLSDLGCDYGQGYLFSRPLSPPDMTPFLLSQGTRAHERFRGAAATSGVAR